MTRIRFRHTMCNEVIESDLVICDPDEWKETAESKQDDWSAGMVDLSDELEDVTVAPVPKLFFALKLGDFPPLSPLMRLIR